MNQEVIDAHADAAPAKKQLITSAKRRLEEALGRTNLSAEEKHHIFEQYLDEGVHYRKRGNGYQVIGSMQTIRETLQDRAPSLFWTKEEQTQELQELVAEQEESQQDEQERLRHELLSTGKIATILQQRGKETYIIHIKGDPHKRRLTIPKKYTKNRTTIGMKVFVTFDIFDEPETPRFRGFRARKLLP